MTSTAPPGAVPVLEVGGSHVTAAAVDPDRAGVLEGPGSACRPPPAMRGRVMVLWALAWGGTTVIGGPLVGWVAQDVGSRWFLVIGGAPTILLGILMLPALRRIDHPAPPGASA